MRDGTARPGVTRKPLLRIVAASLAVLAGTGCTPSGGHRPKAAAAAAASPAASSSAPTASAATGSSASATSVASASAGSVASVSAGSAASASTGPTGPSAAGAAALPPFYPTNPVCRGVACILLAAVDGIHTTRGVLRAEVIGQPIPGGGPETLRPVYIALYDRAGRAVYTTPRAVIGHYLKAVPGQPATGILTDRAGRVFVPFLIGAHSGALIVLDPNQNPVNDFHSVPSSGDSGRFFTDTPGSTAVDLNGDGVNELAIDVNDYQPNYAQGTTYERYYQYAGGDFALLGCRTLRSPHDHLAGPNIAPGGPGC